jgi:hypothetical protein
MKFSNVDANEIRRNVYTSRMTQLEHEYLNHEVSLKLAEVATASGQDQTAEVTRLKEHMTMLDKQHKMLADEVAALDAPAKT